MTVLRTSTLVRGARLAALPTMYAGRTALGAAKRAGGAPAEAVASEIQRRTVEQLCRTLGELKGGALKLGQALSVVEAVMPEELAAPYRATLNALQHAVPALPLSTVERALDEQLGATWRERLTIEPAPAGAASIGQVHRGTWRSEPGAEPVAVAVKVQYPGIAKALTSDLRQLRRAAGLLSRLGHVGDVTGLLDELSARLVEELDYEQEAANQRLFASAFVDDPQVVVPGVLHAAPKVLVTEWLDGVPLSRRTNDPALGVVERDRIGQALVHAIYAGPELTGLMHGDPHPGNFLLLPDGRIGLLDFGAVLRLADGIPSPLGKHAAQVLTGDLDGLMASLTALGFLDVDAPVTVEEVVDYLSAMVDPFRGDAFTFTRGWLRREAVKLANPRSSGNAVAKQMHLPPEYLVVHRIAAGMVGILCQLEATVPLRALEIRWSPGFRAALAAHEGISEDELLARHRLLAPA